jgi:methylated-DNA-[protein]-cysteine S-methyltransferase
MTIHTRTFPTALGLFSIAVDDSAAVIATAFGNQSTLLSRLGKHPALRDSAHAKQSVKNDSRGMTDEAVAQISDYLAGKRRDFSLPLAPSGSIFQLRVWNALRKIPHGQTRSYGDLAKSLNTAARAVGRANATNPICLIVPCHRVIGADGTLTGFAFGEKIKRQLLELEGVSLAAIETQTGFRFGPSPNA